MAVMNWSAALPLLHARYIPDIVISVTSWETAQVWFDENNESEPTTGPNLRHSDFDLLPSWDEALHRHGLLYSGHRRRLRVEIPFAPGRRSPHSCLPIFYPE